MKRVLSIDWDYFINADAVSRFMMFPDGGREDLPYEIQDFIWSNLYSNDKLKEIGVFNFEEFKNLLISLQKKPYKAFIGDSHAHIFSFIQRNVPKDEELEVYNIDFHHDLYDHQRKNVRVDCGNWCSELRKERPDMKYYWIKREDSETEFKNVTVDYLPCTIEDLKDKNFDYIYLCRSSVWSPPHLDCYFKELVEVILQMYCEYSYEPIVFEERHIAERSEPQWKNL